MENQKRKKILFFRVRSPFSESDRKLQNSFQRPVFCGAVFLFAFFGTLKTAAATTETFTNSTIWVAPPGVTSVTAKVWGAGGGGGGTAIAARGSVGGGGGAYSQTSGIAVTPGNSYTVVVGSGGTGGTNANGTNGGDSWFCNSTGNCDSIVGSAVQAGAKGGNGGAVAGSSASGGTAASGVGSVKFSGGNGFGPALLTLPGGGGGESGDQTSNGNNASGQGGGNGVSDGGDGGSGGLIDTNGAGGSAPGGGGGGGGAISVAISTKGGDGGNGQVILVYTITVGPLDHFAISTITSPQTAGNAFPVTFTAQDANNYTVTSFTGTVDLSVGSDSLSPIQSDAFVAGVKTQSITLTRAGSGKSIIATDHSGSGSTGASNTFTVNAANVSEIVFTTSAQTITAGIPSAAFTIQTQDAYHNPADVTASTIILLSSDSSGIATFSSDSEGMVPIVSVTLSADTHSTSFYYRDTAVGTPTLTADEFPGAGYAAAVQQETVVSGNAVSLRVTGSENATVGIGDEITVTAYDASGNIATSYSGSKSLVFSGPAAAPNGAIPTIEGINMGSAVSASFIGGTSSTDALTLLAYKAENVSVDVSDGGLNSFADLSYDLDLIVSAGAISAADSVISASPAPAEQGLDITVTVQARDQYQNNLSSGSAAFVYSVSGANPSNPTSMTNRNNGTYTGSYTANQSGTDTIIALSSAISVEHDTDGTDNGTFVLTIENTALPAADTLASDTSSSVNTYQSKKSSGGSSKHHHKKKKKKSGKTSASSVISTTSKIVCSAVAPKISVRLNGSESPTAETRICRTISSSRMQNTASTTAPSLVLHRPRLLIRLQ